LVRDSHTVEIRLSAQPRGPMHRWTTEDMCFTEAAALATVFF